MHTRSFSIHQRMPRSVRKDQKRTALQLLALSGVVRPSDVELPLFDLAAVMGAHHIPPETDLAMGEQLGNGGAKATKRGEVTEEHAV